jgi:hypothetical protein
VREAGKQASSCKGHRKRLENNLLFSWYTSSAMSTSSLS